MKHFPKTSSYPGGTEAYCGAIVKASECSKDPDCSVCLKVFEEFEFEAYRKLQSWDYARW